MDSLSSESITSASVFRLVADDLTEVERRLKLEALSNLRLVDQINRYLHDSGGKRLRPTLLLLASKLSDGPREAALQLGVVVELIHVATLVHDDIIDNASVRRGRTSINARWGNDVTVLFGDWLYMTAFWIALQERNLVLLDVLIDITRKMVEGELLQLQLRYRLNVSSEDYFKVCWHKTAHLFSGCARLGAIVSPQAGTEIEEALGGFGRSLGMAFQLVDDLLDYTASESTLGKPVLKDLEEGNVTLPIIQLMAKVNPEERGFLESMVQDRSFTPENKARVVDLIGRYGTLDDLRTKAVEYADEARRFLEAIPPSTYKDALAELPGLILNRQS